jgi:hypothetical protein
MSPLLPELLGAQSLVQPLGGDAVQYAGVEHVDATDPAAGRMVGKHPAEPPVAVR